MTSGVDIIIIANQMGSNSRVTPIGVTNGTIPREYLS